ncbi:nucleotidyl transferase AbiEii/AbiGii toxin family protein [Streptomyces viridochromogenes]|uniref:nucleotidyl transferase AbiEii/AbiGii toxin family protein n=1 Tax=Streptomyces viridochromogenes TaxID=1938 RepID=UPI000A36D629|nr:nucleotidyl transferase AbiEii/AbiGii toxin family protein [Streptomyces viridochromogenes]
MIPPRRHLTADVLTVGARYALVLAGECAVRAHGLAPAPKGETPAPDAGAEPLELPGGDDGWARRRRRPRRPRPVEVATQAADPMDRIAAVLGAGLAERGWEVRPVETDPLSARLLVTDPDTGVERTVDVVKETFWRPPVTTDLGPALALEDVIGTKVRALADRGTARDVVDVYLAAPGWTFPDLEEQGRRHAWDALDPADLQSRLEATDLLDDREFTARGLPEDAVPALRRWIRAWADDIAERLLEEEALRPPPEE